MSLPIRVFISALVLASISVAAGGGNGAAPGSPAMFLDVAGRSDDTPWVAASGAFVAVTSGATKDGQTDVFLAVSRDGGATFGSPVQVNTVQGEARLGGELPPRVALRARRDAAMP